MTMVFSLNNAWFYISIIQSLYFQVWHLEWQYIESYVPWKSWPVDLESDYFCKLDSFSIFFSLSSTKQVNFPDV